VQVPVILRSRRQHLMHKVPVQAVILAVTTQHSLMHKVPVQETWPFQSNTASLMHAGASRFLSFWLDTLGSTERYAQLTAQCAPVEFPTPGLSREW
jgi:hypothetical protein